MATEVGEPGAPRIYTARDLIDGELHPIGLGLAAVFTRRAPESDEDNQDSCALIPFDENSGLLVVADGAGGLPAGARASELAVNALRAAVKQAQKRDEPLRLAVLDGIEQASRDVAALGVGAATTLAVAEVQGNKVRTYHVGDSQILVIGPRGKIKLETKSHSPTGYAVEAGLMDPEEAIVHESRHLVSNLVGMDDMHIEVGSTMDLAPLDTVVVASDGLFDNLHVDEIAAVCRKGTLLAVTRQLAESCHARMQEPADGEPSKPDDLTMLVYRRRASV